jgi:hypothetical protein
MPMVCLHCRLPLYLALPPYFAAYLRFYYLFIQHDELLGTPAG